MERAESSARCRRLLTAYIATLNELVLLSSTCCFPFGELRALPCGAPAMAVYTKSAYFPAAIAAVHSTVERWRGAAQTAVYCYSFRFYYIWIMCLKLRV